MIETTDTDGGTHHINTYSYYTFYHGYVPPQEAINLCPR